MQSPISSKKYQTQTKSPIRQVQIQSLNQQLAQMNQTPQHAQIYNYQTQPQYIQGDRSVSRIVQPVSSTPTSVTFPPTIQIQATISTETLETSPERFISRIKTELQREKEKNYNLERQIQEVQRQQSSEYWIRMYNLKDEELQNVRLYYEQKFTEFGSQKIEQVVSRNDDYQIRTQEYILELQNKLRAAYQVIDELDDQFQKRVISMQQKQKTQIDQLILQLDENNRILAQYNDFNGNIRKVDDLSNEELNQRKIENEALRSQLYQVNEEFLRVNQIMKDLVQENNYLQAMNETLIRDVEMCLKIILQLTLKDESAKMQEFGRMFEIISNENQNKREEISSLKKKLFQSSYDNDSPSFKRNTEEQWQSPELRSNEESQENLDLLKMKKNEISKLQGECQNIKQIMQKANEESLQNDNQFRELKFKYDILQEKIQQLQHEIVTLYSREEND